jgi:hypothetical protein
MPFTLHRASLRELNALFRTLPAPDEDARRGFFRAEFVGPAFIRLTARPTLEVTGLPGWQGKKFLNAQDATNVLKRGNTTVEHLAMRVTPVTSYVDGKPGLALTYPAQNGKPAPVPWRWVRDEIRQFDDDTILAFTFVDLPLLRHVGFPFLLVREG